MIKNHIKLLSNVLSTIVFTILVLSSAIIGQERLRLVKADILESKIISGVSIQFLRGNVVFTKGDLTLHCNNAQFDQKKDWGELTGSVEVLSDNWTLTSDTLEYMGSLDALTALSNAHIWDKDYDLRSDTLTYFTEIDSGFAHGNARLVQTSQTINANALTYVKIPGDSAVSYIATGNVEIIDGQRVANCGKAVYLYSEEKTLLLEQPVIIEEGRIISGSEIQMQYSGETLENLYIPSNAYVENISTDRDQSYKDIMIGQTLKGTFENGSLLFLDLKEMASTVYHVFEDSVYQGENTISGDSIKFLFFEGEVDELIVSGGARGVYTPVFRDSAADGPVSYSANKIEHKIESENSFLYGKAKIDRKNMELNSGFIIVDWASSLVKAFGKEQKDTVNTILLPTLVETGKDPMTGEELYFNMKTRKGKVIKGKTKTSEGIYLGTEIRNAEEDVFLVENSLFTTCDLDDPHFHFKSKRMKIIQGDKVIARPLFLYIQKIPVLGLPFAIFPHQSGKRHSGWIMPSYGESKNRGQFIDGLGFYWAPNEYWDTRFLTSFADRQGIFTKLLNRYNVRYKFSGNLHLEFRRSLTSSENDIMKIGSSNKTDYVAKWNHSQVMRNNQSLRVSAQYYSNGEYNRNTGLNPTDRLKQQAISNATYTKRWKKINSSVSVNLSSQRDLMADRKVDSTSNFYVTPRNASSKISIANNTLPSIGFRKGQSSIFKSKSRNKRWYNQIAWNYSSRFNSKQKVFFKSEETALTDSTTGFAWEGDLNDDGSFEGDVFTEYDNLLSHSISIQSPQKWFKYISVNPSISIKSSWVDKYNQGYLEAGEVKTREEKGFATQTTGSFRLNTKTQIYGMFPVKIKSLRAIRHTISPTIGFSYTPDFSKPLFGYDFNYFETFTDSSGETISIDKFKGTTAGSTPSREKKNLNFGLNNVFQAKIIKDEKEQKRDLFSWNMSTSYNHLAKEYKWANVRSSVRTTFGKKLRLDVSMTHDLYKYDFENEIRTSALNFNSNNMPKPRLINARFSTSFNFEGKSVKTLRQKIEEPEETEDSLEFTPEDDLPGFNMTNNKAGNKLWSSRVSLSYSVNKTKPSVERKTFWMNTNTSLKVTSNWRVSHNARFDLNKMDIVNHSFSISRDLHCWEMSVSWTPSGYGQGFYLRINVKSPNLRDLKFEKKGGMFRSRANF